MHVSFLSKVLGINVSQAIDEFAALIDLVVCYCRV